MNFRFARLSLLSKILLSTSVALTTLFAVTGWIVLSHVVSVTSKSVEEEAGASLESYESLWKSRADKLASVSLILSTMSDVRAAFGTGDLATIRDTANELWARVSDEGALFLVTDPKGRVMASLGGAPRSVLGQVLPAVAAAAPQFPNQAQGFLLREGALYQVVLSPVYVQSAQGPALLNVLVAGYAIDSIFVQAFRKATGGSDLLFTSAGRVVASTLNPRASTELAKAAQGPSSSRLSDGVNEYSAVMKPLVDFEGKPVGELWILRSFEGARQRIAALRSELIVIWLVALSTGLMLTYLMARKIVEPVQDLDRAAGQVALQNYDLRVKVTSEDELGRLARTFNTMCDSIQAARGELIRQERISTIGRLSSSIVHDLRNPLAAIYGGAEMLVDSELAPQQMKRLAANIYRASRRIQELLQDLVNVSRGRTSGAELCRLGEVVAAAVDASGAQAENQNVTLRFSIPDEVELPLERNRIERVFLNLIGNALEAMPEGGEIRIDASVAADSVRVQVEDNGPGIPAEVRQRLFEPFVTAGKKNGLGLGLALARQTVLDHGGDLWVESKTAGARFVIRLPLKKSSAVSPPAPVASSMN